MPSPSFLNFHTAIYCLVIPITLTYLPRIDAADHQPVLRVLSFYDPAIREIATQVYEFENEENCFVDWTFLYHEDLEEAVYKNIESYDVVSIDEPWLASLNPKLLPVAEWPKANITYVDDNNGWLDQYTFLGQWYSETLALPAVINFYIHVYRADVFADPDLQQAYSSKYQAVFEPPKDLESLLKISEFLYENTDYSGFAALSHASEGMVVDILYFLAMAGTPITDRESLSTLDPDKIQQALNAYTLIHSLRSPASSDWTVDDINDAFIRGEIAHTFQWTSLLNPLRDPLFFSANASTAFKYLPYPEHGITVSGVWLLGLPLNADPQKRNYAASFVHWFRERIEEGSLQKTQLLYDDPENIKVLSRPQLIRYPEFSNILRALGVDLLEGNTSTEEGTDRLIQALNHFLKKENSDES